MKYGGIASILELFLSCILEIQPERSEQTLDGMKWNPEWLDFYDFLLIFQVPSEIRGC